MKSEVDPAFEKKLLEQIVKQMEDEDLTMKRQIRLRKFIMGIGTTMMLVAFLLAMNSVIHPFGSAVLATFAGSAIGYAILLQSLEKQWPVTIRYVDVEAVRSRLEELENESSG